MRLLALFAHPDDESFRCGGTLALLARHGARVQVLTATRGESGSCGQPRLCTPEELPTMRQQELCCSCAVLGLDPPILLRYPDGKLSEVDGQEALTHVLAVLRDLRPQVLLTWPPDGLSGHPDHVAVSRWATLAFEQATTGGAVAPAALYYMAVPRSVTEALAMPHLQSVPDEEIDLAIDATPVWEQKLAAIQCHRTQASESPILAAAEEKQRIFLGTEHFRLAQKRMGRDFLAEQAARWRISK